MSTTSRPQQWLGRLIGRSQTSAQPPTELSGSGDATVEVAGTFLLDVLFGLGPYRSLMLHAMVRHDIGRVNPEAWYERKRLVSCLEEMGAKIGPHILFWIGKKTSVEIFNRAEAVAETPHDALVMLDRRYRMAHRVNPPDGSSVEGVGEWTFERQESGHASASIESPYPQQWLFGLLSGAVRDADPLVQVQALPSSGQTHRFDLHWNL